MFLIYLSTMNAFWSEKGGGDDGFDNLESTLFEGACIDILQIVA